MSFFLCDAASVTADLPVRAVLPSGVAVAIFQIGDQYFVTDDLCTHGKASLSEGFVEDGEVECPFHQGRFDIRTGKATASPCVYAVKTYRVFIHEGGVFIDEEEL